MVTSARHFKVRVDSLDALPPALHEFPGLPLVRQTLTSKEPALQPSLFDAHTCTCRCKGGIIICIMQSIATLRLLTLIILAYLKFTDSYQCIGFWEICKYHSHPLKKYSI